MKPIRKAQILGLFGGFLVAWLSVGQSRASVKHADSARVYSAMDPSEGPVDAPAKGWALTPVENPREVNRKPAVEPRVYVENAGTKTGFAYYDYADQTPSRVQHPPTNAERGQK